jgi:hypothetical protein
VSFTDVSYVALETAGAARIIQEMFENPFSIFLNFECLYF